MFNLTGCEAATYTRMKVVITRIDGKESGNTGPVKIKIVPEHPLPYKKGGWLSRSKETPVLTKDDIKTNMRVFGDIPKSATPNWKILPYTGVEVTEFKKDDPEKNEYSAIIVPKKSKDLPQAITEGWVPSAMDGNYLTKKDYEAREKTKGIWNEQIWLGPYEDLGEFSTDRGHPLEFENDTGMWKKNGLIIGFNNPDRDIPPTMNIKSSNPWFEGYPNGEYFGVFKEPVDLVFTADMPIEDFEVGDIYAKYGTIEEFKAVEGSDDKVWTGKFVVERTGLGGDRRSINTEGCKIYVDSGKFSDKKNKLKNEKKSNEFVFSACSIKPTMEFICTSKIPGTEDLITSGSKSSNPFIILNLVNWANIKIKQVIMTDGLPNDYPTANIKELTKEMFTVDNCRIVSLEKFIVERKVCNRPSRPCPNPDPNWKDPDTGRGCVEGINPETGSKMLYRDTGKGDPPMRDPACFQPCSDCNYKFTIKVEPIKPGLCTIQIKEDKYIRSDKKNPMENQASEVFEWTYEGSA